MRLTLLVLFIAANTATIAHAQGYYQRNVRRNPVTGRLQVVDSAGGIGRIAGPHRDQNSFYGSRFNPYTGNAVQSRVRRNPVTGRLDLDNEYYNPWTGAKAQTRTRFNPFTRRYETTQVVTPPNLVPPSEAESEATTTEEKPAQRSPSRSRPRVIETDPSN